MAKHILFDYTFDASEGTITFSDTYDQKRFLIMTNVTTGDIIYNFADGNLGGTFEYFYEPTPRTVVTLNFDTTSMSDGDSLQIFYDADKQSFAPADEYLDPVSKIRVSNPENLIDTDFEYGLQSTKWETIELTNNIPTFFTRNGDLSIKLSDVTVSNGSTLVKVTTELDNGLLRGSPIYLKGTTSILADGGFIVKNVIDSTTFTYEAKGEFSFSGSIKDTYTELFSAAIYDGTEFKLENTGAITTDEASPSLLTVSTKYPTNFKTGTSLALTNSFGKATIRFDTDDVITDNDNTISFSVDESSDPIRNDHWGVGPIDKHGWEPIFGKMVFDLAGVSVNTTTNTITFPSDVVIPDNYYQGWAQSYVDQEEDYNRQIPLGFVYVNDVTNTPIGGLEPGRCYWLLKTGERTAKIYNQKTNNSANLVSLTSAGVTGNITKDAFVWCVSVDYNYDNSTDYFRTYADSHLAKTQGYEQGDLVYGLGLQNTGYVSMFSNPDYSSQIVDAHGWDASTPFGNPEVHPQFHNGSNSYALNGLTPYIFNYSANRFAYFTTVSTSWWGGTTYSTINVLTSNSGNNWCYLPRSGQVVRGLTIYKENHGLKDYDQVKYSRTLEDDETASLFKRRGLSNYNQFFNLGQTGAFKIDDNSFGFAQTYWNTTPFIQELYHPNANGDGRYEFNFVKQSQKTIEESNRFFIEGEALNDGDQVTYVAGAGNTTIGGLTDGDKYYVLNKSTESFTLGTSANLEQGGLIQIDNPHLSSVVSVTSNYIESSNWSGVSNGDAVKYLSHFQPQYDDIFRNRYRIGGLTVDGIYYVRIVNTSPLRVRLYPTSADAISGTNEIYLQDESPTSAPMAFQKLNTIDVSSTPSTNETQNFEADFIGAADGNYTIGASASDQLSFEATNQTKIESRVLELVSSESVLGGMQAFYAPDHGFITGQEVTLTTSGTVGTTVLVSNTTYYVISTNRNIFKLATTKENALDGTYLSFTLDTQSRSTPNSGIFSFKCVDLVGRFDANGTVSGAINQKHLAGVGTTFTSFYQKGDSIHIAEPPTTNTYPIDSGTDLFTSASANFTGGMSADVVFVKDTDLDENTIYYFGYQSATTFTLHCSLTDAINDTNRQSISSLSGTSEIIHYGDNVANMGEWLEVEVASVNDDNSIELTEDLTRTLTDETYSLQTKLLLRPDGFALHRPYDGGVELIAPTNPDSQMVRQTRKYFRYQSGKGIQVSFAVNFSPSTQIDNYTRSGTTATITTRYPHRLTPNLQITTFGATNAKETLSTQVIEVSIGNSSGTTQFEYDGERPTNLPLLEGRTYKFDLSDAALSGHDLRFSTTEDGTHNAVPGTEYTTGVTTNGTPGTSGAYTQIVVPTDAPTLYSYCTNHANMGLKHTTPVDPDNNQGIVWNTRGRILSCPTAKTATFELDSTPADTSAEGSPEYYVNGWDDCTLRCGLFDDQNGLFFEYDGTDLWAVIRNSTKQLRGTVSVNFRSGEVNGTDTQFTSQLAVDDFIVIKGQSYRVVKIESNSTLYIAPSYRGVSKSNVIISKTVENRVKQSDWNIDRADGTGRSGFKLDIHKIQMAYIDYSWYGAGKVRFGFKDQNGNVKYVHSFAHGNYKTEAYMRSGNMPARYELFNGDSPTYTPALAHWGTSVIMDGRFDSDRAYLFNAASQGIVLTGEATTTLNARAETVNRYIERFWGQSFLLGYALELQSPSNVAASRTSGEAVSGADLNAGTTLALPLDPNYSSPYIQEVNTFIENEEKAQDAKDRTLMFINQAPSGVSTTYSSYTFGSVGTEISLTGAIPLISIRLSPSVDTSAPGFVGEREIINRMQLILSQVSILTTHAISVSLKLNGKLSTTAWQRVANPSLSQLIYHQTGDTITEGQSVYDFEAQGNAGTTSRAPVLTEQTLGEIATLGNSILGGDNTFPDGPDVLTVVAELNEDVTNISVNNPFKLSARISWSESQA